MGRTIKSLGTSGLINYLITKMSRQRSKRAKWIASGLSKTDCIPIAEKRKVYYNSTMNKFNNELTAVSNLRKSKCLPIIKSTLKIMR